MQSRNSREQAAYEDVARVANPALTALRPIAAVVLDARASTADIVRSCASGDAELKILRDAPFGPRVLDPDPRSPGGPTVSDHAVWIVKDRAVMCHNQEDCRAWCVQTWTLLVSNVDRFRSAAKKHGVEIHALR